MSRRCSSAQGTRKAGTRLAMSVETATSPRDAYVFDIEHNRLERWTHSETGPVDAKTFVTPDEATARAMGAEEIYLAAAPDLDRYPRVLSAPQDPDRHGNRGG